MTILTTKGLQALANASTTGVLAKVSNFGFSENVLDTLDPNLKASDIKTWIKKPISLISNLEDNNIEFTCAATQNEAIKAVKTICLYLSDGTLFAIAQIKGIDSELKQSVKIQISFNNINDLVDIKDIPSDYVDVSLSILDTSLSLGETVIKNAENISMLKILILKDNK